MKTLAVLAVALVLSSTSALAYQEKPSPETTPDTAQVKSSPISQFSNDDNDGAIAQAYGPSAFTGSQDSNTTPAPHYKIRSR